LTLVAAALALFGEHRASAQYQTGGATGTGFGSGGTFGTAATLASTDFTILYERYDGTNWVQMNTVDQQYFFNQARCQCGQDPMGEFRILIQPAAGATQKIQTLLANNLTGGQGVGRLFAAAQGIDCLTTATPAVGYSLKGYCTNLLDPGNYPGTSFAMSVFANAHFYLSDPIPVAYLFNSLTTACTDPESCSSNSACSTTGTQTSIQFWAQTNSGLGPDFDPGPAAPVTLVGSVPIVPTNVSAEGGNEALNVTWSWPLGINVASDTTLFGVQLFCQRGADNEVFAPGSFGATFDSPAKLCPSNAAAVPATSSPFSNLSPIYLCSDLIPANTTSHRITGLQNGVWYGVAAAAVDRYHNVSAISNIDYGMPVSTVDFYTAYQDQGGSAQGGFCAIAGHNARSGMAALALIVGAAVVLRLRRRSKKRPSNAGPFLLVVGVGLLASRQAHAQPVYYDSSFAENVPDETWNGSPRQFAIEARFGLYQPDVDTEFRKAMPHADVFGTKRRPMWQVEFDWEFLQKFGTLSLGGVVGYYKESAQACLQAKVQPDGSCPADGRSGDSTGLRLIPLAALLVYRMDEAANHWQIPLVPYAKIGLNYTIWSVTNGNGDVAWAGRHKGQGGTMGWQAAVGLSLSLDFLDPSAARGFDADSGVNHTYAFFELAHIDGSGLYRKDVLRVGDNTWFAGLMFEF
jgi:hypothetical protein